MNKLLVVSLAIFAVSTSGALAAKGKKPKPPATAAATTNTGAAGGAMMMGQMSAADHALYQKSQRESGMKKK